MLSDCMICFGKRERIYDMVTRKKEIVVTVLLRSVLVLLVFLRLARLSDQETCYKNTRTKEGAQNP